MTSSSSLDHALDCSALHANVANCQNMMQLEYEPEEDPYDRGSLDDNCQLYEYTYELQMEGLSRATSVDDGYENLAVYGPDVPPQVIDQQLRFHLHAFNAAQHGSLQGSEQPLVLVFPRLSSQDSETALRAVLAQATRQGLQTPMMKIAAMQLHRGQEQQHQRQQHAAQPSADVPSKKDPHISDADKTHEASIASEFEAAFYSEETSPSTKAWFRPEDRIPEASIASEFEAAFYGNGTMLASDEELACSGYADLRAQTGQPLKNMASISADMLVSTVLPVETPQLDSLEASALQTGGIFFKPSLFKTGDEPLQDDIFSETTTGLVENEFSVQACMPGCHGLRDRQRTDFGREFPATDVPSRSDFLSGY